MQYPYQLSRVCCSNIKDIHAGKNSFLWVGTIPNVIITDPEQIKQVFNKNEDFPKPKLSSIAKYLSIGLLNLEGEKWVKHRKIISPAFHIEKLKVRLSSL
jgi:cytochrome P450